MPDESLVSKNHPFTTDGAGEERFIVDVPVMVTTDKDYLVRLADPGDRLYSPVMSGFYAANRPRLREVDTVTEENNIRFRSEPGLKELEEEFVMSAEEVRVAAVP